MSQEGCGEGLLTPHMSSDYNAHWEKYLNCKTIGVVWKIRNRSLTPCQQKWMEPIIHGGITTLFSSFLPSSHPSSSLLANTQGTLRGFDQTVNVILAGSHERVYSTSSGVEQVQLGLYIIRGDNM